MNDRISHRSDFHCSECSSSPKCDTYSVTGAGKIQSAERLLHVEEARHLAAQRERPEAADGEAAARLVLRDVGEHALDLLLHLVVHALDAVLDEARRGGRRGGQRARDVHLLARGGARGVGPAPGVRRGAEAAAVAAAAVHRAGDRRVARAAAALAAVHSARHGLRVVEHRVDLQLVDRVAARDRVAAVEQPESRGGAGAVSAPARALHLLDGVEVARDHS